MDTVIQLFSQFGVTWPKFLAQVILFLTVYIILKKFAFGPIIAIFEERRKTIEEGQANAEKIKKQLADSELPARKSSARPTPTPNALSKKAEPAATPPPKNTFSKPSRTPKASSRRPMKMWNSSAPAWSPR